MERAAGFAHDDTARAKLDKLDAMLAQTFTSRPDAALFAEMLSLANDGRYPTLDLSAQQRRQKTFEALTAQVEVLLRSKPVLVIFEDAHWIDPTSLEGLGRTVDRLRTSGVLLIITYRPEFDAPWVGRPHVTVLNLNRLEDREIDAMIDRVASNTPLPNPVKRDIIQRTDGVPLFVEEITKAVLEAGEQRAAAATIASMPSLSIAVPPSLHASLMARLDRLGFAKETAQIGAAIGREFTYSLLSAVSPKTENDLQASLLALTSAGLLFRQGTPPHATYLFKHALVQDAAYGTLLREPRRALHVGIAETLESEFPEVAESQPELLARHYADAGLIRKAASLWGKAGLRSVERSALVEAVEQLGNALRLMETIASDPDLRREQIKLQVASITPLIHVKGYAAPETRAAVERAHFLIEQVGTLDEPLEDPLLLFSVLYGFWVANYVAFNGDLMRQLAAQFLSVAEKQKATLPLMTGHRIVGTTLLYTGDFAKARLHLDEALALYDPIEHRPLAARFGTDAAVSVLFYRSMALWSLGYPDAALADANLAVREAREIGQASTLMAALAVPSITHILCGKYADATSLLDEAVALADEKGSLFWKAHVATKGCALTLMGEFLDAVRMIKSGMAAWRSTGTSVWTPTYLAYLAKAYAELGQFDDALRCVGEAMTAVHTSKEQWYEPEVQSHRRRNHAAVARPRCCESGRHFERALTVARHSRRNPGNSAPR